MSVLAKSPDLSKIIKKAVERIGENHTLAKDTKGVEMNAMEIEKDRLEFRKGRINESDEESTQVIEEALKAVADEMAEKMVLENTIDDMVKEVIEENKKENRLTNESTRQTIEKLVGKKLKEKLLETKMPGYDAFEKAYKKSTKETENYHKDLKKKLKDYTDYTDNSNSEFPHQNNSKTDYESPMYRNTTEDEEFIDDFAYPGLQDFDVHNQNMDRLTKYLEGSSDTGNAQTDEDGEALGNVVPSKLGEKIKKSVERRKEKIEQEKASMTNLRGITPDVQKVVQVKEEVSEDVESMKKLWNYNQKTQ
jgi:hypothetical protein|tara:strand:- start:591 stop:1511 length:921 start_codon:yes stop_codon:yes gene_type:complete